MNVKYHKDLADLQLLLVYTVSKQFPLLRIAIITLILASYCLVTLVRASYNIACATLRMLKQLCERFDIELSCSLFPE